MSIAGINPTAVFTMKKTLHFLSIFCFLWTVILMGF